MKTPDPGTPRQRDAASLLPALGVFLLMPPVITLFAGTHTWLGVPLIVAYLFGVWLALIVAAALLARRLAPPSAQDPAPPRRRASARAAEEPVKHSATPARAPQTTPLVVANARRSPSYVCALRLDRHRLGRPLGRAGILHRR